MSANLEKATPEQMDLFDSILDNQDLLEAANEVFFEEFDKSSIPEIDNTKDDKVYAPKKEFSKLIEASVNRKDETFDKIRDSFEKRKPSLKDDRLDPPLRRAEEEQKERERAATASPSTQQTINNRYGTNSSTVTTSSTVVKTIFVDAEERAYKFTNHASKSAREMSSPSNKSRRRKKTIFDKIGPRGSKRRRAAIIGTAVVLETVISALFLTQIIAKNSLYEKMGVTTK